jgi:hypothetical protein
MYFPREQPLDNLVKHPRTVKILLDMYEGLAQSCDEMIQRAKQVPLDTATQANLDRLRDSYARRIGVDVTHREKLRQEADRVIQQKDNG